MEAIVIYHSKTGITKKFAGEIQGFLKDNNIQCRIESVNDVKTEDIQMSDVVLLGCWTSGLFLFAQHPDGEWKKGVKKFPELNNKKIGFFTTYKLATGSMFKNMQKELKDKISKDISLNLKSKNGLMNEDQKKQLMDFLR